VILAADTGGNYVAAAYVVFLGLVLVYVAIMAFKLARFERELAELNEIQMRRIAREREQGDPSRRHRDAGLEAPRR